MMEFFFISEPFSVMADPLEHATGLERKELEAIAKGNPVSILIFGQSSLHFLYNFNKRSLILIMLYVFINFRTPS